MYLETLLSNMCYLTTEHFWENPSLVKLLLLSTLVGSGIVPMACWAKKNGHILMAVDNGRHCEIAYRG